MFFTIHNERQEGMVINMKTVSLVFGRFVGYFKRDKSVFILYFAAGLLCTLVFFFAYTNLMPNITRLQKNDYTDRYYTLNFDGGAYLNGSLLEKMPEYNFENVYYYSSVSPDAVKTEGAQPSNIPKQDDTVELLACETNIRNFTIVSGKASFSEDELEGNPAVAIMPYDSFFGGKNPSTVYINSIKFDIVGALDTAYNSVIIPYTRFVELNLPVQSCEITLSQVLGYRDSEVFTEKLLECLPGASIDWSPMTTYNTYLGNIKLLFALVSVMYLIFIMLFAFLVRFMVENSSYESAVFLMVGASKQKMLGILMLESLSLCIIQWLMVVALYKSPLYSLVNKINLYKDLTIGLSDCLIVLLTMMLITAIVMLPFYIGIVKRTARQALSEYTY